ncbi:hypothetical protein CYLTODRAFT_11444 [Cylindrobasidium torrendii FP15055 ss-10]|uniref:Uncharacterized protein n=1 Tax=Cylindrobasidium torrendii FP15055 ss-10 TaxID=1314674 RepID=A0A0D7BAI6_9AGAR|nr:hypothetical protein CYLTODRAFT_11444 [Cylindrobasidium torrendii FP15055 ss-10]
MLNIVLNAAAPSHTGQSNISCLDLTWEEENGSWRRTERFKNYEVLCKCIPHDVRRQTRDCWRRSAPSISCKCDMMKRTRQTSGLFARWRARSSTTRLGRAEQRRNVLNRAWLLTSSSTKDYGVWPSARTRISSFLEPAIPPPFNPDDAGAYAQSIITRLMAENTTLRNEVERALWDHKVLRAQIALRDVEAELHLEAPLHLPTSMDTISDEDAWDALEAQAVRHRSLEIEVAGLKEQLQAALELDAERTASSQIQEERNMWQSPSTSYKPRPKPSPRQERPVASSSRMPIPSSRLELDELEAEIIFLHGQIEEFEDERVLLIQMLEKSMEERGQWGEAEEPPISDSPYFDQDDDDESEDAFFQNQYHVGPPSPARSRRLRSPPPPTPVSSASDPDSASPPRTQPPDSEGAEPPSWKASRGQSSMHLPTPVQQDPHALEPASASSSHIPESASMMNGMANASIDGRGNVSAFADVSTFDEQASRVSPTMTISSYIPPDNISAGGHISPIHGNPTAPLDSPTMTLDYPAIAPSQVMPDLTADADLIDWSDGETSMELATPITTTIVLPPQSPAPPPRTPSPLG